MKTDRWRLRLDVFGSPPLVHIDDATLGPAVETITEKVWKWCANAPPRELLESMMPSEYCYACKEKLARGARRCSKCHAWQGWRRYCGELNLISCSPYWPAASAIAAVFVQGEQSNRRIEYLEQKFLYDSVYAEWEKAIVHSLRIMEYRPVDWNRLAYSGINFLRKDMFCSMRLPIGSVVFDFTNGTFEIYQGNPDRLISLYDPKEIDDDLLNSLHAGPRRKEYRQLFESGEITGGIGTLYVKHDLAPKIGMPQGNESRLAVQHIFVEMNTIC